MNIINSQQQISDENKNPQTKHSKNPTKIKTKPCFTIQYGIWMTPFQKDMIYFVQDFFLKSFKKRSLS